MISIAERLSDIPIDERSVRLDCTPEKLRAMAEAGRLAVGGMHIATTYDVEELGFAKGTVVPDVPEALTPADVPHLARFCADDATPSSLCIGFGALPDSDAVAQRALQEVDAPGFKPFSGTLYDLGPYTAFLIDVLNSRAGTRTTIIPDPRIPQPTEKQRGGYVGFHFDNGAFRKSDGSVAPVECLPRATRMAQCLRRVIINAGPGERKSIFGLTHSALYVSDELYPNDPDNMPTTSQLRRLLAERPEEAARAAYVAVTLAPGELIVITAGNAPHDGSMLGCDQPSRAVVFAGNFRRHAFDE